MIFTGRDHHYGMILEFLLCEFCGYEQAWMEKEIKVSETKCVQCGKVAKHGRD